MTRLSIDPSSFCPGCGERRCDGRCMEDGLTLAERRRQQEEARAERRIRDYEWDRLSGGTLV